MPHRFQYMKVSATVAEDLITYSLLPTIFFKLENNFYSSPGIQQIVNYLASNHCPATLYQQAQQHGQLGLSASASCRAMGSTSLPQGLGLHT